MNFAPASIHDLKTIATWITEKEACLQWAGPKVSYPIDLKMLQPEIMYSQINSFVGLRNNELVAFGQLLKINKDRHHMARIIVKPGLHGIRCGTDFCLKLIERARELCAQQVTLKVCKDNKAALGLYGKLGFQAEDIASATESLYMVKSLTRL